MLTAKFVNYNQLKHGFSPSFSSKQINKADCIYAQYDICAVGIAWTDGRMEGQIGQTSSN